MCCVCREQAADLIYLSWVAVEVVGGLRSASSDDFERSSSQRSSLVVSFLFNLHDDDFVLMFDQLAGCPSVRLNRVLCFEHVA